MSIQGIDELFKKLDSVGNLSEDLYNIIDKCGEFVRDDARVRVPVISADLKKSIQHTTTKTADGVEAEVHTNSDHAAFVEFGTGPVGAANHNGTSPNVTPEYAKEKWLGIVPECVSDTDKGLRYIAGQKAQPYLYPALKDNEEQLTEFIKDELAKKIKEKAT